MNLRDFVDKLNRLLEKRPETGEFEAVYSIDDEGNAYHPVHWTATVGNHDGEYHGEFISEDSVAEEPDEYDESQKIPNAVCIN